MVEAQLPRLPGGIMSSRYCRCSCSAAWRWISIICEAADCELEPLVFELELEPEPVGAEVAVPWDAPISWAMARAW